MADSDSDDELMSRLTSAVFARAAAHEDCVHCGAPNATVVCSICHSAHYCSDVRDHVQSCIACIPSLVCMASVVLTVMCGVW